VLFDDLEFVNGVEEFDTPAAEFVGDLADPIQTPLVATDVKTPIGDGLLQRIQTGGRHGDRGKRDGKADVAYHFTDEVNR